MSNTSHKIIPQYNIRKQSRDIGSSPSRPSTETEIVGGYVPASAPSSGEGSPCQVTSRWVRARVPATQKGAFHGKLHPGVRGRR